MNEPTALVQTGPVTPGMVPPQKAPSSLLPTPQEYRILLELADKFIETGFLPKSVTTPAQALTIMLTGRELNLPPMLALRMIHVIDGKPGLASELQLARFRQAGGKYRWLETNDRVATIQVIAPGSPADWAQTFTFTIEEARDAGLLDKQNWKKYKPAMLRARVASLAIRAVAPEVSMGLYDPDELGAVTNEEGEVEQWPEAEVRQTKVKAKVADANVVFDADPILPLDPLVKDGIRMSDPRCHVGLVLAFVETATKDEKVAAKYAPLIQKAWGVLPEKVQDATVEQLEKTLAWLDKNPGRAKVFTKWGDEIVDRLEVLTTETVPEEEVVVHEPASPEPALAAAESNTAELMAEVDEAGPGGTFDVCEDGLLPDGPKCPRCGGERAPSGVDGGSWVHVRG